MIIGIALVSAEATQGDAATTSAAIGGVSPPESPTAVLYVYCEESGSDLSAPFAALSERVDRVERAIANVEFAAFLVAKSLGSLSRKVDALAWRFGDPPNHVILSQWRTIHNDWTGPGGSGVDPDGGDLDGDGDADLRDVWQWRPQRTDEDRR